MVRLLLEEQKVAVDTVDAADGITAFHCACYHGHAECAAAQMWAAEAQMWVAEASTGTATPRLSRCPPASQASDEGKRLDLSCCY